MRFPIIFVVDFWGEIVIVLTNNNGFFSLIFIVITLFLKKIITVLDTSLSISNKVGLHLIPKLKLDISISIISSLKILFAINFY